MATTFGDDARPSPTTEERLRAYDRATRAMRSWFESEGFVAVDTPVAIRAPAPEAAIEAPVVHFAARLGETALQSSQPNSPPPLVRYLQTSPELAMKRLLATTDLERIYQLAPVFRDGDLSPRHNPEFRLLEWYRKGAAWEALLADCEALLRCVAKYMTSNSLTTNTAYDPNTGDLRTQGQVVNLKRPFLRLTVAEAFEQYAQIPLLTCLERPTLAAAAQAVGIAVAPSDTWDDLFFKAMVSRVEPALSNIEQPIFLTHYPASQASLAQLDPADPRVAQRFELYVAGVELANGFGELTNPTEQRRRFEQERRARRKHGGRSDYPIDEPYLAALERLPPTAGIALGWERLLMLMTNASHLDEVTSLPWSAA